MFGLFKRPAQPAPLQESQAKGSLFSTHRGDSMHRRDAYKFVKDLHDTWTRYLRSWAPRPTLPDGATMDDSGDWSGIKDAYTFGQPNMSDALFQWFGTQSFIGHQACAIIAQHWMVNKICAIPARDAIRQGFEIVNDVGEKKLSDDILADYARYDEQFDIYKHLLNYVYKGRIFGIRVAFPIVESTDPDYYEKQFNEDGVRPGAFKGWVQVDPYWMAPQLDGDAASKPDTPNFYEPTWWQINGKRYHRSHLCIFRTDQPVDILKPSYLYGGVPVPQRVMERVYAAERTGNEAPLLVLTKRLQTFKSGDISELMANKEVFDQNMAFMQQVRDNFGVRVMGSEDDMQQFDTSLADLWTTIEGEYALACAAGDTPVNKVMGTAAGGLSNEGAYDESNHHEFCESIQTHDLTPFLKRHHLLVRKSYIEPKYGAAGATATTVSWMPLDSPTAKEYAEINELNARADLALVQTGAVSDADVNSRLRNDKNSGYSTLKPIAEGQREPVNGGIDPNDDLQLGTPGKVTVNEQAGGNDGA